MRRGRAYGKRVQRGGTGFKQGSAAAALTTAKPKL